MAQTPQPPLLLKKVLQYTSKFVLQYASNLYCSAFGATELSGKGSTSVLLPFVPQYASHLYCNTPPICIAILLGKSWWLWSPGYSLQQTHLFCASFLLFSPCPPTTTSGNLLCPQITRVSELLFVVDPILPFLDGSVYQGKPQIDQGFSLPAKPPKALEKPGKTHK